MNYYKVLGEDAESYHGGIGSWHKPVGKRPGKWMPNISEIHPCKRGYHLVTIDQLPQWLGPTIWRAEGRGEHKIHSDKHVFSQARLLSPVVEWDLQVAKWWALECLEHALPLYEKRVPGDTRLRSECALIRRFLNGEIDLIEFQRSSSPSFSFSFFSFSFSSFPFSFFSSFSFSPSPLSPESSWWAQHFATKLGLEWDV